MDKINSKAFNRHNQVFNKTAIRDPHSLRKKGVVKDVVGEQKRQKEKEKKKNEKLDRAKKAIQEAKRKKGPIIDRSGNTPSYG